MFEKVKVFVFLLWLSGGFGANQDWDIAVAVKDQIVLLTSNGTYVGTAVQELTELKALTFDSIRHQFLVSDMHQFVDQYIDTIFNVRLSKETDITPIVKDLPDDVQGLAIDPITDTLYWTDSQNKTINYVSLKGPDYDPQVFLKFDHASPKDLAIDSCGRYLYWTMADITHSSIQRATLSDKKQEILVNDDLGMPAGIAIDQKGQRIYWIDDRHDIYYRIESTDLKGKNRSLLYEGTHQSPISIAVDDEFIYWSDALNNALWRKRKNVQEKPENLRKFDERPHGIVLKNFEFTTRPSCDNLLNEIKESLNISATEYFNVVTDSGEVTQCLNNGELTEKGCKCQRGYVGKNCENSLCYNYCLHGDCSYSSTGYPQCHCPPGFDGLRCEHNVCESFCLNDGTCHADNGKFKARCSCPPGFAGLRCEMHADLPELCNLFCLTRRTDLLVNQRNTFMCRCDEGLYTLMENNVTAEAFTYEENPLTARLKDPMFLSLLVFCFVVLFLLGITCVMMCKLRKRPRIKKRIIVNKNVTPLTYRPQPSTEQCEITIENCCNMNVCETPCFEPSQIRGFTSSKKDEKKTLLSNMENGTDDLY